LFHQYTFTQYQFQIKITLQMRKIVFLMLSVIISYSAFSQKLSKEQMQKEDWLQKRAIAGNPGSTYDTNERLKELGKFYDKEDEYKSALVCAEPGIL